MQPDLVAEKSGIHTAVEAWASALGAKDAGAVVAHYAPGFVQFSMAPPLQTTVADERALRAWFDTWAGPIGYDVGRLAVSSSGDLAVTHGLCRICGTKVCGERIEMWFRQTLSLRRIGGTWRIAHQHTSVPFYMDGSYRAAVDLAP